MSFEARCPQCLFVSRQLGQPTPCLLHVSAPCEAETTSLEEELDYDEPYAFGQLRPTVDRTGPFTLREYVKLQLLKTRLEAQPSALDQAVKARSLSRR